MLVGLEAFHFGLYLVSHFCHHLGRNWGGFNYLGSNGCKVMASQTLQTVFTVWRVHFEVFRT